MIKSDGTFMVWSDDGGHKVKPQNWMTPPTVVEEHGEPLERIVVRKLRGEEQLEIAVAEVLSDVSHELGDAAELRKEGVEAELQQALAGSPAWLRDGLRLVRREWPTDIGPVDLVCRDEDGGWVAVEVKRVGTIEAVEQLTRYLERLRQDPELAGCRGILAAQQLKPQARVLAEARGIDCVEVDLELVRGAAEPALSLF
jgi:RecB family endonuclease NucS